ncbi:MAG: DUF4491 domain-containing protein [Anaerolineales bacterium]|nr:DUF4491 family protein [Anaerolineae bacterium]PWB69774.1 MAG: DUF4491 domain-containing protein [Anaerolineales bacterium]
MNWFGFLVGIVTFFIIGLGFVWVIRGERYFGYLWWPYVMGLGALSVVASLFLSSDWGAVLLGSFGASLLWGSTELKEQAIRGELGWYPFRGKKIDPPFVDEIRKWKAPSL